MAVQRKNTLTWSIETLNYSHDVYCQDCMTVARRPKRVPPCKKNLPYDDKKKEALVFQPDQEKKAHVVNVAEYFQNREKFLEVLR